MAEETPEFSVWGNDRTIRGPMRLMDLVRLVEEGSLTAESWLYLEPEDLWQKAGDLFALRPFFSDSNRSKGAAQALPGYPGLKPEAWRRVRVFGSLDERQIQSILTFVEIDAYPQFTHIVRKGEHGDAMYFVLEGEVRALTIVDGMESTLTTIEAGGTFGEGSLLDGGPRLVDVVANKDSILGRMSAQGFDRLLREAPGLGVPFLLALGRTVVGRVRSLTKRYEDSIHFVRKAGLLH